MIPQHSMQTVLNVVCDVYDIQKDIILSPKRTQKIGEIRLAYYYLARLFTNKTLLEIAYFVCRRDHTTVIHGVKQIENFLQYDKDCQDKINQCIKLLEA